MCDLNAEREDHYGAGRVRIMWDQRGPVQCINGTATLFHLLMDDGSTVKVLPRTTWLRFIPDENVAIEDRHGEPVTLEGEIVREDELVH